MRCNLCSLLFPVSTPVPLLPLFFVCYSVLRSQDCVLVLSPNFTNPWSFSPGMWLDWVEFTATSSQFTKFTSGDASFANKSEYKIWTISSMSSGFQQNKSSLTAQRCFNDGPVLYSQIVQKQYPLVGGSSNRYFFHQKPPKLERALGVSE